MLLDEETMKGLECCTTNNCSNCPFYVNCESELLEKAFDLAKRQKTTIEELMAKVEKLEEQNTLLLKKKCKDINTARKIIKSKAIKEFAERLKDDIRLDEECDYNCINCCYECKEFVPQINKLTKEMIN